MSEGRQLTTITYQYASGRNLYSFRWIRDVYVSVEVYSKSCKLKPPDVSEDGTGGCSPLGIHPERAGRRRNLRRQPPVHGA